MLESVRKAQFVEPCDALGLISNRKYANTIRV